MFTNPVDKFRCAVVAQAGLFKTYSVGKIHTLKPGVQKFALAPPALKTRIRLDFVGDWHRHG